MKTLYLINNVKENPIVVYLDLKDKLENYSDLIKDAVLDKKVVTGFENIAKISSTAKNKINYQAVNASKKTFTIDSPLTEKLLSGKFTNVLTVAAICLNQQNKRIGYLCLTQQGDILKLSDKNLVAAARKKTVFISNMFLRESELVATKASVNIPQIVVGSKITEKALEPKAEVLKLDFSDLSKFRPWVKTMILKGYGPLVEQFRLNNKNFSDDTLHFYYILMKNNELDILRNMLTTQAFDFYQLEEIADGLRLGVNIKEYADTNLDADEMKKIKIAMVEGVWDGVPMTKQIKAMAKKAGEKKSTLLNKYKTAVLKSRKK